MDVFGIALSGMQAAQAQLNVTANNVANLETPGYQAQRVDLVDISGGGVAVGGIATDTNRGPTDAGGKTCSNVDLATEMVNLTRSQLLYSANAAVMRVGQKTSGALLDIFDNQNHENHSDRS